MIGLVELEAGNGDMMGLRVMMREQSVSAEMEVDDHGGAEEQDRRCLE